MDFKRLLLLLLIIALGLFLKEKYDERKQNPKSSPVAVKSVSSLVAKKVEEGEKTLEEVLGSTTTFVAQQASKSAGVVTSLILEKSSQKIVEQIEKLPEETKQEVKEAVCR